MSDKDSEKVHAGSLAGARVSANGRALVGNSQRVSSCGKQPKGGYTARVGSCGKQSAGNSAESDGLQFARGAAGAAPGGRWGWRGCYKLAAQTCA